MKVLLVFVLILFDIRKSVSKDDGVVATENTLKYTTCSENNCVDEKTENVLTETSNIIQTNYITTNIPLITTTVANKNLTNNKKKNNSLKNQSENETSKNKDEKLSTTEIPKKNKNKPKPKLKENKTKSKSNKTEKGQNGSKSEDSLKSKVKHLTTLKSCNCDTTSEICDINCCCDEDCSKEKKAVFSRCEDESNYLSRSDYCFSPSVIYRNNTPYRTFNLRPGMLCIAKDNLPDKIKYYTHKVIESKDKIENIIKKRKIYQWKNKLKEIELDLNKYQTYSYGSPVWMFKNYSNELKLQKLSISHEGLTSFCQDQYEVGYLEEYESSCLVKGPSNEADCLQFLNSDISTYKNLYVLISPHLINSSFDSEEESIDEFIIKVQIFICSQGKCFNLTSTAINKLYDRKTSCKVIRKVVYVIRHNGTRGISEVKCYLHLDDFKLTDKMHRKDFSVKYNWIKITKESFQRSGKPGYLRGKPLIIGNRTDNVDEDKNDVFAVSHNLEDWITILMASNEGICSDKRENILFNQNIRSECRLHIKEDELSVQENCSALWHKVMRYLHSKDERLENIWISAWGDPRLEDVSAWVPLVSNLGEFEPSCTEILTTISYKFLYSLSGPLSSPNTKLVGAVAEMSSAPFNCQSKDCILTLITTVSFSSVSSTPKLLYPKHPALRIHLPKDFFYPFSSSSLASNIIPSNQLIIYFALLVCIFKICK